MPCEILWDSSSAEKYRYRAGQDALGELAVLDRAALEEILWFQLPELAQLRAVRRSPGHQRHRKQRRVSRG